MNQLIRHVAATLLGTVGVWLLAAAARISPETAQITFEDEKPTRLSQMQDTADRIHLIGTRDNGDGDLPADRPTVP